MKIFKRKFTLTLFALVILGVGAIPVYESMIGTSLTVRFGGTVWLPVDEDTPFLSRGLRSALHTPVPEARPGPFEWRRIRAGFDVAELPVLAGGEVVDRILLARIDPARFRFVIHNNPAGVRALDDWMGSLKAALVVNGSYYGRSGLPATPTIIEGTALGPADYDARHGAFIAGEKSARLADLASADWKKLFEGARNAVVSYPLLLARDGSNRAPQSSNWLANRSFLAEDRQGRIIVGTTRDAFFSLGRLAAFLKHAPLDLSIALNLDGGPLACQGIELGDFRRRSCGRWEVQIENGQAKMLPPLWLFSGPPMPVVLAVYPVD